MISKETLEKYYVQEKMSVSEISRKIRVPQNTINYWLNKHGLQKRSISEAIYRKKNPKGDPFKVSEPKNIREALLFGLGIGLYWGEGTKRSLTSVRLCNTDPRLIQSFLRFLVVCCGADQRKIRFGLQVFSDMDKEETMRFWSRSLGFPLSRFQKPVVTPHRGVGNYRFKTRHGVLTVYFHNKKLRDKLLDILATIEERLKT